MDNQHRKIDGYRELSNTEIALINQIKQVGHQLEMLDLAVAAHLKEQSSRAGTDEDENMRIQLAEPHRWRSIARTHFQQGTMALVRAVAQPKN